MFLLYNDFTEIEPEYLDSTTGLSVDIENVLTDGIDGGDPTLRPECLPVLQNLQAMGKQLILLTGCKDKDFTTEVQRQVSESLDEPVLAVYRGLINETTGKCWPGKHHPAMFYAASNRLRVRSSEMAHIDDQFKSHVGAIRAGYGVNIWTMPWGAHEHPGVAKFRPIEMTFIRGSIRRYHAIKNASVHIV